MTETVKSTLDWDNFYPILRYPHPKEVLQLIEKFQSLRISIKDVTSEEQHANHQKVVEATYNYNGKSYVTKPLYYKNILYVADVKRVKDIVSYFGEDIYWLDIGVHDWPKPSKETDIDNLIVNDITDDVEFKALLTLIANNANTGWIQRITQEGKSMHYHRNLENNNHWHDLILLIQEAINKGEIGKSFFKSLVFKWDGNKNTDTRLRSSLSPHFGSRTLISRLIDNVNNHRNLINKENMISHITEILKYKKQIILQGPPGTGKTRKAKQIAKEMCHPDYDDLLNLYRPSDIIITFKGDASYKIKSVEDNNVVLIGHKNEDIKPKNISFEKILMFYHSKRWLSNINNGDDRGACALAYNLYSRADHRNKYIKIVQFHPSFTYEDFVRGIEAIPHGDRVLYEASGKILINFANSALDDFKKFLAEGNEPDSGKEANKVPLKNYILIIDEINRANLSSVLGELIYALEYRGDEVESIYRVNDSNKISLPPNLYIIGTMNTADRSVGHIDYAIRRRFAFVDVPPERLTDTNEIWFNASGYERVEKIFNEENVSNEFNVKDVQLGHSYFIVKKTDATDINRRDELFKMKMDYEIKPILREYVKDGVLLGQIDEKDVSDYIENL